MLRLSRMMKELEDRLAVCGRCGACLAVCPIYGETGLEADVARGKLALLDGLLQAIFKDPHRTYRRLNRCLLCGSCAAGCPSKVDTLEIFIAARMILTEYLGFPLIKKLVFRAVVSRPKIFNSILAQMSKHQALVAGPADKQLGTIVARIKSPLLKNRHFIPLAIVPFHKREQPERAGNYGSGIKVVFFTGCLIDKIFPHVAEASLSVLKHHKVEVLLPEDQGCCGIPAISSGDKITFDRLIRHHLEQFNPDEFDYLITSCATCASTIKKRWPMMTANADKDVKNRIKRIAEKTFDISEFLVAKTGLAKQGILSGKNPVPITYHDPCHLKKSLNIYAEPRALIQINPGYMLREMPESDFCCGMGGSFNLEHYDLSANIGKRKHDSILASGCSVVATGCPACMLQISDLLSKSGAGNFSVKHPIEIYAEGLTVSFPGTPARQS